jgi:hypothetical protein
VNPVSGAHLVSRTKRYFLNALLCREGKIECMPIGEDENYRFDYSRTKGIELKFSNNIRC